MCSVVAARIDWIDSYYETEQIVKYLDYLLLLSYDMRVSKENKTRITSALFPRVEEEGFESTLNQV